MIRAFADLALRRPRALLVGAVAVLAVAIAVAATVPGRLGVGSLRLSEGGAGSDFSLVTRGDVPANDRVYRVALNVITSKVRTDPSVEDVEQGPVSGHGRTTSLAVTLRSGDPGEVEDAAERIAASIDPGPLHVYLGGEPAVAIAAWHDLSGQLWKLELLALPFVLLVLWGLVGLRVGLAAALSAAIAIAGTLAVLRLLAGVVSLSLLGVAPAAVVGLVLGLELACTLALRFRDETQLADRAEALRRAMAGTARLGLLVVAAAVAATVGLVATPLDQAGSIVLGCGLAAALAAGAALAVTPAMLALPGRAGEAGSAGDEEPRAARAWGTAAGWLARGPVRVGIAGAAVVLALLALGMPGREGDTRPLGAADLPAGTEARMAAELVGPGGRGAHDPAGRRGGDQSLFGQLPLAVGVSLVALALVLLGGFRSPRALLGVVPAFLPALAACGMAVAVFQDGHLADLIGQRAQDALETGALACLLAALAAVGAARAALATAAVSDEESLGLGAERTAEHAAAMTMPVVLAATLVGAAAAGVLAGADLYPAREFGLAVAAGLLLDLLLIRAPLLAALARSG